MALFSFCFFQNDVQAGKKFNVGKKNSVSKVSTRRSNKNNRRKNSKNVLNSNKEIIKKCADELDQNCSGELDKNIEIVIDSENSLSNLSKKCRDKLAKNKTFYYREGLDKLEKNLIFRVGVENYDLEEHDVKGRDESHDDCEFGGISVSFSPTFVNKLCGGAFKLEDDNGFAVIKNVTIEVINSDGKSFKFTKTKIYPLLDVDLVFIFIPNVLELNSFPCEIKNLVFDKDFKIKPGEKCVVRIIDSNERVLVSGECHAYPGDFGGSSEIAKYVAHPEVFDEEYNKKALQIEFD